MRKWLVGVGILSVLGWLAWLYGLQLLLPVPGLLGRLRDPIGPMQEVHFEAGPAEAAVPAGERPPNIIVILVDDLGWNDLTWRGGGVAGGSVPTPNIDSLARDGVRFTMGYAGNATCAPSRAAIMTGRYPERFGFEFTPVPKLMPKLLPLLSRKARDGLPPSIYHAEVEDQVPPMDQQAMPATEMTLAELLKAHGYHTAMFGKWHLGASEGTRPHDQGFDEFLGFYEGGQMYGDPDDPQMVNSKQDFDPIDQFLWPNLSYAVRFNNGPRFTPDAYMTDYLSNAAVKVIHANRNRPFFIYLAYNAPHTPLQATREDYEAVSQIGPHAQRVYGAMVRALDRGVGHVLEALREQGLAGNTLVIFTSDNGGAHYVGIPDLNHPYRGWKMTFFEGGVHTPFFMRWPAQIPSGSRVSTPVAHIDVFATAAAAAGAPLPSDRVIDGMNLLPFATAKAQGEAHHALFWRSGDYRMAISGGFKLQISDRVSGQWLYDLSSDPTEQVNLAATRPQKLAEMRALLDAWNEKMGPPAWPSLISAPIPVDKDLADDLQPDDFFVYWNN